MLHTAPRVLRVSNRTTARRGARGYSPAPTPLPRLHGDGRGYRGYDKPIDYGIGTVRPCRALLGAALMTSSHVMSSRMANGTGRHTHSHRFQINTQSPHTRVCNPAVLGLAPHS
eukprot:6695547-Prymnesium_polylepis.1